MTAPKLTEAQLDMLGRVKRAGEWPLWHEPVNALAPGHNEWPALRRMGLVSCTHGMGADIYSVTDAGRAALRGES